MEPQTHVQYEPLKSQGGVQHPRGSSISITTEPDPEDEQPAAPSGDATSEDIALEPLPRSRASSKLRPRRRVCL